MEDRYVVREDINGRFAVVDTYSDLDIDHPDLPYPSSAGYETAEYAQDVADVFNKEYQCMTDLRVDKDPVSEYYRVEYLMFPFGTDLERKVYRSTLSFKARPKAQDIIFGIFLGWGLDADRARWMASAKIRNAEFV